MIKKSGGLFLNLLALSFIFFLSACKEAKPPEINNNIACGPSSINELKKTCPSSLPQWLLSAETEIEKVSISKEGYVSWHNGDWLGSTWLGGTWKGGTWLGGTWEKGTWKYGTWEYGTWLGGTWENGTWHDGTWLGGTWKGGTWHDGNWLGGTWENGTWINGTWEKGTWKGEVKGSDFDPTTAD